MVIAEEDESQLHIGGLETKLLAEDASIEFKLGAMVPSPLFAPFGGGLIRMASIGFEVENLRTGHTFFAPAEDQAVDGSTQDGAFEDFEQPSFIGDFELFDPFAEPRLIASS